MRIRLQVVAFTGLRCHLRVRPNAKPWCRPDSYLPAGGDGRAAIRQAQIDTLSITNTGMAVTLDIGAAKEHPANKHDIGLRHARWALSVAFQAVASQGGV